MVQRFGRTGRKRIGKVIILLTKGEEKSSYINSLHKHKNITKEMLNLKVLKDSKLKLYSESENVLTIPASYIQNIKYIEINKQSFEENSFDSDENLFSDNEEPKAQKTIFNEIRLSDFECNQISNNNIISNDENKILSFQIFNTKSNIKDNKKASSKFESKIVYKEIQNDILETSSFAKKKNPLKKIKKVHFNLNHDFESWAKEIDKNWDRHFGQFFP